MYVKVNPSSETASMFRLRILLACALVCPAPAAFAATATNTFNVTMTITAQCAVTSPTTMAFPSTGLLTAPVNQTSTFNVICTNTTPYTVGLDNGGNQLAGQRRMKGGTANNEFINYNLYQDSARTTAWGNATGSWQSGVGNGQAQAFTVFGQVPAQNTPSPSNSYIDTVTITVTY
jgi:spore coat protein U-like protein